MNALPLSLPDTLYEALIWVIAIVLLLIVGFLFAAVYRRIAQSFKYRKLDRFRAEYDRDVRESIDRAAAGDLPSRYAFRPGSLRWKALEHVLFDLSERGGYRTHAFVLFARLGYVAHYGKSLRRRNVIERSLAIDKLGRMRNAASADMLLPLLSVRNSEIVTNTVRALARIGSLAGLEGILARMDDLLANGLVSRKMLETSLPNFGRSAIPLLLEAADAGHDAVSRGSILEVLACLSAEEGVPVAMRLLADPNPEVRSRALKLIGISGGELTEAGRAAVLSLLDDPVWFVRLQAAKTMGAVGAPGVVGKLGDRLMDPSWQVRNAAATALTRFGNGAIPVFLATLEHTDRYARESVCEEIEKTGFVDLLIANLGDRESGVYEGSKRILQILAALNYRTPHDEYLKSAVSGPVRHEIEAMIAGGPCG